MNGGCCACRAQASAGRPESASCACFWHSVMSADDDSNSKALAGGPAQGLGAAANLLAQPDDRLQVAPGLHGVVRVQHAQVLKHGTRDETLDGRVERDDVRLQRFVVGGGLPLFRLLVL